MRKQAILLAGVLAIAGCTEEKTEEEKLAEAMHPLAEALGYTPEALEEMEKRLQEDERDLLQKRERAQKDAEKLQAVSARNISVDRDTANYSTFFGNAEVTNELDFAISEMYLRITATSPARSVPWNEADEYVRIAGGIEPGETRKVRLVLSTSDGWQIDEFPEDVEYQATAIRVRGPEGETVYDADPFSSFERAQLTNLDRRDE